MCGGSAQTTQQIQIPPEVLARYNSVNARAEDVASKGFQQYGTDPSAFVAPLSQTQQAGVANVNAAQNIAQPYFQGATSQLMGAQQNALPYFDQATQSLLGGQQAGVTGTQGAYQPMQQAAQAAQGLQGDALNQYRGAFNAAQPYNQAAAAGIAGAYAGAQPYQGVATGLAAAGTQAVNAGPLGGEQINQYMSPYLNSVVGSTMANLRQQQGQEQSSLLGNQIAQGAFGGDRGRIAQANLARQQNLATGQTVSGLMNQGYGQALGAAQQQQQLGLGAAQANRAALQQGANQMLGIGQQGYGQGIGSAQAMAGLGQQQYAQQSGLGQNLAQLGQQGFGQGAAQTAQQAALAQQLYGMGAGTAGQLAGLGQGIYGMGSGTSQGLAGLGTQAQQNALGAAQAQLGAGTLQQQTEQAGLQALYNQFLQQQGFPYQQAQFLANIAMGTGALSGSTTQTTQPASFMGNLSDKRAKDNIEPIGKTFDGQNIVRFKYKNEPGTRIGLIAQDVEKHHPEAVGLAGGYKTVDYDKATEAAARKGKYAHGGLIPQSEGGAVTPYRAGQGYADGGSPSIVGPTELAALQQALQAQLSMYGGAGLNINGTPGATGVVPAANLPTANLVTAGPLPDALDSGLNEALDTGEKITGLYKSGKEFYNDVTDEDKTAARGGLVGHYAMGGMPGKEGYIPEEIYKPQEEKKEIETPRAPGQGKSDFSQAVDAAKTAAQIAAMFAANGGRIGKVIGGPLENEEEALYPTQMRAPRPAPVETKEIPPPGAYSTLSPAEKVALNARMDAQLDAVGTDREAPQERTPVPAPQPQKPAQTPARYADVPFERVQSNIIEGENRGVADPYNSVYGSGKYGNIEGGLTSRTLGDVQDFQRNTLIPATRGKIAGVAPNMGTGAVGAYQFTHGTLGSVAPQVFGKDWRNVPFNQENQDKMARALYEQNRGSDTNLARQWASFSGLAPSGRALVAQSRGVVPPLPAADAPAANAADATANPAASTDGLAGKQYAQLDTGVKSDAAPAGLQPSSRVPMPKPDIESGPYNRTERILLPLLAGLGTMAGSKNRYGLGALAEGIGGGASAYAKMQQEQYSKGQEQQKAGIEAEQAQAETTSSSAQALNVQLQLWTKLNEQIAAAYRAGISPPQYLVDARDKAQRELLSAGVDLKNQEKTSASVVPKKAEDPVTSGAGVAGEKTQQGDIPSSIYDQLDPNDNPVILRERAKQIALLDPALSADLMVRARDAQQKLLDGKAVDKNGNVIIVPGSLAAKAATEGQTLDVGITGEILKDQRAANRNATAQLNRVAQMNHQMENIPDTGFLTPGTAARQRQEWALGVNSFLNAFGAASLFDPNQIAANEELFKDSTRLGFELSGSFNNSGAQQIVQQSVGATPSTANSKDGYRRITAALTVAAKYEQARTAFYENYAQTHNYSLRGAEEAFVKENPPEKFVKQAIVMSVPPDMVMKLKQAKFANKNQAAATRQAYDQRFGKGVFDAIRGDR